MALTMFPGHPCYPEDGNGEPVELEDLLCEAFRADGKVCGDNAIAYSFDIPVCKAHLAVDREAMRDYIVEMGAI